MDDDPLARALSWVEARLHRLKVETDALTEVRHQLLNYMGSDKPDGWAQIGSRPEDT